MQLSLQDVMLEEKIYKCIKTVFIWINKLQKVQYGTFNFIPLISDLQGGLEYSVDDYSIAMPYHWDLVSFELIWICKRPFEPDHPSLWTKVCLKIKKPSVYSHLYSSPRANTTSQCLFYCSSLNSISSRACLLFQL